jgi:hypothetical protein
VKPRPTIRVEIGELVLDGVRPGDPAVRAAVEREVGRALAGRRLPRAQSLGKQVADAVHARVKK